MTDTPVLPNPLCKFWTKVGNIGDSRVLLGRADGTIVEGKQISMQCSKAFTSHPSVFLWLSPVTSHEGPGTDGGLTTDHKPDHPVGHKVGIGLIIQSWSGMQHSMACKRSYSSPSIAFMWLAHIYLISIFVDIIWYNMIYDICWSTLARHPLAARPVGSLQCRFALLFRCVLTRLKWSALSALAELHHPEETIFR